MRRLVPLSLVALLLLSGCLGGIGGSDRMSTPEDLMASEADLPPGVNESGLQNVSTLVDGYNETVREEGIVLNVNATTTGFLSGKEIRRHNTVFPSGGHPFDSNITVTHYDSNGTVGSQRTVQFWGNESTTLQRSTLISPSEKTASFSARNEPTQAKVYLNYLKSANYTINSVDERDGHTYTMLVANETSTHGETLDVRLVVDERGLIHELTMSITGGEIESHREHRIIETNPSPPEKPDWTTNVTSLTSTPP